MRRGLILSLLIVSLLSAFVNANPAICKRSFSNYHISPSEEVVVTVEINKGAVAGIAKLVEDIPEGLTAYEGNSASTNGVFTFEQQKLKIVWLNVPAEAVFKVTYKLRANGDIKPDYRIIGKFSYLVNELREEFFLSEGVLVGATDVDAHANLQASTNKTFVVENAASVKPDTAKVWKAEAKTTIVETAQNINNKTTLYKVQLGVFADKKGASIFKTLKDISNEEVAGKYKYYSGSFTSKEEANKRAEEAKKLGFSGAYVVSFVNGKRTN